MQSSNIDAEMPSIIIIVVVIARVRRDLRVRRCFTGLEEEAAPQPILIAGLLIQFDR